MATTETKLMSIVRMFMTSFRRLSLCLIGMRHFYSSRPYLFRRILGSAIIKSKKMCMVGPLKRQADRGKEPNSP